VGEQICRLAVAERLVRRLVIVEMEVAVQRWEQFGPAGEIAGVDKFVLQAAPQALDENVVQGTARPSMLMEMSRFFSGARKSGEVNWDPWSAFQISGWPKRKAASSGPDTSRSPSHWKVPN
jgi:hypothetical protein